MKEVYIRTTNTFWDVDGGWDDINGGSYGRGSSFNPSLGELCANMTNFTDSEVREFYCPKMFSRRFIVLHTTGPLLQFCEIQVYNQAGKRSTYFTDTHSNCITHRPICKSNFILSHAMHH